jgi:hypothetical protein
LVPTAGPERKSTFNVTTAIFIAVLIGFYGSTTIVKIFECSPRDKIFDLRIPGKCVNGPLLLNICDSFNTITDLLILFLPTRAVWELQVSKLKKTLVVLLFVFGLSYVCPLGPSMEADCELARLFSARSDFRFDLVAVTVPTQSGPSPRPCFGGKRKQAR